jgi:hypothetical protein
VFVAWVAAIGFAALIPHQVFVGLAGQMRAEGFPAAVFGQVVGLNGLLIVLIQPWLVRRLARIDPLHLFAASALLQGIGFSMHGLGIGLAGHVAAVTVWTFGEILGAPVFSSVAAALAPPHLRARYQGLTGMAFSFAGVVGPGVGAVVLERGLLWPGCLVLGMLAASVSIPLGPRLRARLAA